MIGDQICLTFRYTFDLRYSRANISQTSFAVRIGSLLTTYRGLSLLVPPSSTTIPALHRPLKTTCLSAWLVHEGGREIKDLSGAGRWGHTVAEVVNLVIGSVRTRL